MNDNLKALILNCTLKKSPEESNTQALIDIVTQNFDELGVAHEPIRPVDFKIPFGVVNDMGDGDEWPQILDKILAADIMIMGMSIWFGVRNSVIQMVIERLDGSYELTNENGQYPMYNKVAGVVVTGNEDGAHACAETTLFNMTHMGFTVPPIEILAADIMIMGMSIWFGVRNSVIQMVIERLDGSYELTNENGQYPMYNKVAGVVVTGNEDGAHACAETTLFNMTHMGFTVPPN